MKKPTLKEAKKKIYRFCAYQERSHKQVKIRLKSFGLSSQQVDEITVELIGEGFLNEERFARAFAGGKFRLKKWGKLRIIRELEMQEVSANCIMLALKEIETEDYLLSLKKLLERKLRSLDVSNPFVRRDKAARYAITKGFEPELVWRELRLLLSN